MGLKIYDMRPNYRIHCPQCAVKMGGDVCWNCKWKKGEKPDVEKDPFKYLKEEEARKEEAKIPKKTMRQEWFDRLYELTIQLDNAFNIYPTNDAEKFTNFIMLREFILGAKRADESRRKEIK